MKCYIIYNNNKTKHSESIINEIKVFDTFNIICSLTITNTNENDITNTLQHFCYSLKCHILETINFYVSEQQVSYTFLLLEHFLKLLFDNCVKKKKL